VFENVGFIIDDGKTRFYITSDTICFNNDYHADYVFAPVTGHGITMSAFETALFVKETGAKKLFICHMDNPAYTVDLEYVKKTMAEHGVDFVIPNIGQTFEII
jgi:L-ascorbate metabolism protein UlaG (beta-lactamase superfamily)